MILLRTGAASRAALCRPLSKAQINNIARRHTSTDPVTKQKAVDVTSNTTIPTQSPPPARPFWQRLGVVSRSISAYGRTQQKYPYRTQFVTSLVIYFLGDLSAQNMSGDEYDPVRTGRALVISACSSIPSYKWFMFLNDHFNYRSKVLSLGVKVVVNQIVFAPTFNTYFFGMQSFLSGASLEDVWERVKRTVPTSLINSVKFWPAVTAFSFTFIEPQYRSIFAGGIAIGWQTYLSYLNRSAEKAEASERAAIQDGASEKKEIQMAPATARNTEV